MSRRHPSLIQRILRGLVLRLVMLLDGLLGVREAVLRARLRRMPAGHRHRRALERDLARLEHCRAVLADPDFFDDARLIGTAAEVARVRADAGRRGWIRLRWIYGWATRFRRLPAARVRVGGGWGTGVRSM
jgi:hypothetical protein